MKTINTTEDFAEVFESSLIHFQAQSWRWDTVPAFGSLVIASNNTQTVYGIIYDVKTESLDPMREAHVYQKTEIEMKKEYPYLFEFLKTTFQVLILGYQNNNIIIYSSLKIPIKIYSFVRLATNEECINFFESDDYIHTLLRPNTVIQNYDLLLETILKTQKSLSLFNDEKFSKLMTQYALITNASYSHLKTIIDRLENLL